MNVLVFLFSYLEKQIEAHTINDMYAELNPYAPGSGLTPPELAGRQGEIDAFDLLVARTRKRNHSRGIVLHGLRGVGKTVLLKRFQHQAEAAGWLVVALEGSPTEAGQAAVRQKLGRAIVTAAHKFDRTAQRRSAVADALSTVKSFSLSIGVASVGLAVEPNPNRSNSGQIDIDLEELIEDLAPPLRENSTALGIFIDEMQDIDSELLTALLLAQHRAGQDGIPFFLIGAGLPSLPAILSESRSYAERLFDYRHLGALSSEKARDALTIPAERLGVSFTEEAITSIVTAAGGYPYFLQAFAMNSWSVATEKVITAQDAQLGIIEGQHELDMGFYPARWDRATAGERRYLLAMAEDGDGPSSTGGVATRLGTSPQGLSTVRQGLIDKGIIFAPERGAVAFTVPGMALFIQRMSTSLGDTSE